MLEEMERALLLLESQPDDSETMNALFRSIHTIKGSAGMFGMSQISGFTHHVENVLDLLRQQKIGLDEQLSGVLLRCHDHVGLLLDFFAPEDVTAVSAELEAAGNALIQALQDYDRRSTPEAEAGAAQCETETGSPEEDDSPVSENRFWHISLRLKPDTFSHGLDPFSFIMYLKGLGTIVGCHVLDDELPLLAEIEARRAYIGFEIDFDSQADKNTIADVFSFMADDCLLKILPPFSRISSYVDMIRELDSKSQRLGKFWSGPVL
jgi:two-component system chemotaxis sensor kinase CheA